MKKETLLLVCLLFLVSANNAEAQKGSSRLAFEGFYGRFIGQPQTLKGHYDTEAALGYGYQASRRLELRSQLGVNYKLYKFQSQNNWVYIQAGRRLSLSLALEGALNCLPHKFEKHRANALLGYRLSHPIWFKSTTSTFREQSIKIPNTFDLRNVFHQLTFGVEYGYVVSSKYDIQVGLRPDIFYDRHPVYRQTKNRLFAHLRVVRKF